MASPLGATLTPASDGLGGSKWNTFDPSRPLTAQEFVEQSAVLLQGVVSWTGAREPKILAEQLRSTLGLGGRLSSLPMPQRPDVARANLELFGQAEMIGEQIAVWAGEALQRLVETPAPLSAGPLMMRSHCDGHSLTNPVIALLTGPAGGQIVLQLYNEWLHQMVLVRDALLPFANWREVPLIAGPRGLRHLEGARDALLTELLLRQVKHTSVVEYARAVVTATAGGPAGYGFQYPEGSVLPEVVGSSVVASPTHLLRWSPAPVGVTGITTFVYATDDYYAAPRTPVDESLRPVEGDEESSGSPVTSRLVRGAAPAGTGTISIELTRGDDETVSVDLGQALRGHRYAYRTAGAKASAGTTVEAEALDAWRVLAASDMVWSEAGVFAVDGADRDDIALALLGRLHPENVVLRTRDDEGDPLAVGQSAAARFIVTTDS